MIVKLVSGSCEHLRHNVLIQIPEVGGQFVAEKSFVDDILRESFVAEGQRDKETGVADKHLVLLQILRTAKTDIRIVAMVRNVHLYVS